jgi:hypothetical protein
MKKITTLLISLLCITALSAKTPVVEPSYAWKLNQPLGERISVDIDTLYTNYAQTNIPSMVSDAYATTGNLGAEGETLIYFDRKPTSDFFFNDALRAWMPSFERMRFYNTRIPMTLASYNFGGGKNNTQDRLKADFSGNINSRAQVGALLDYLYSKGSYNYQATKDLSWGFSGSYIGDKYQFQGFYYHYNFVNKENGGITDDLYITDPAEIQGGSTSIDTKNIPTNLTDAFSRIVGGQLYLNNRYNLGHYTTVEQGDTTINRFVPVSSFIWALDYKNSRHVFHNGSSSQDKDFWDNTYLTYGSTHDATSYWSIRNTVGIALLEGFNKYAQAGLSVFLTHEYRKFKQTTDTINRDLPLPTGLSELPISYIPTGKSQNLAWVGARLTRQQGRLLNYEATAEIGFIGDAAGEFKADGNITSRFNLAGDSLSIKAYGSFHNTAVPYLLNHYISNHFAWDNDFSKTRRFRVGGEINSPRTLTTLNVGVENVQNLVYFNAQALPQQCGSSVQVFSARLSQDFRIGILGWQNRITYQTSTNADVIPLPKLAIYSNLFINFKVAHVLDVQFGVDCDYYTKYRALAYQPATMSFYNQNEVELGNYPFMNLYANMQLGKTRFYIMFSHINQGWTGNNYFALPHYPLNPRRFQLGFSIDFAN